MKDPLDSIKHANSLLKRARDLDKQSFKTLDKIMSEATGEDREKIKPLFDMRRRLAEARAKKDTDKVLSIISELTAFDGR